MIERLGKGRNVVLLVAVYVVATFVWLGFGPAAVLTQTGMPLLDTVLGYGPVDIYQQLAAYGALGRGSYASFLMGDFLIGPLFAVAVGALVARALVRGGRARSGWRWLLAVPLSVALLDWVENASLLSLTRSHPGFSHAVASVASISTFAKLVLGALSVVMALLALAWLARDNLSRRGAPR